MGARARHKKQATHFRRIKEEHYKLLLSYLSFLLSERPKGDSFPEPQELL